MYRTALNTYAMDCMYEQTLKHDVRTSDEKNRNALKCGGLLIRHDVIARGPRAEQVCVCVYTWLRGRASDLLSRANVTE